MGKFGDGGSTRLISYGRANATFTANFKLNCCSPLRRLDTHVRILSFGEICHAR